MKRNPGLIGRTVREYQSLPGQLTRSAADATDRFLSMPVKLNNRKRKQPTPAQLEARRLFAERARSGAFKKKKPAKKKAANPVRFKSEKEFAAWRSKAGPTAHGKPARRRTKKRGIKGTVKAIGRNIVRGLGMAHNPRGQHLPGLPAKYQRMYEDVLASAKQSGRYPGREKEVAARTVEAAAHGRKNPYPSLFRSTGRRTPGHIQTSYGKGGKARRRAKAKKKGLKGYFAGIDRGIMRGSAIAHGRARSLLPNPRPGKSRRSMRAIPRYVDVAVRGKGTKARKRAQARGRQIPLSGPSPYARAVATPYLKPGRLPNGAGLLNPSKRQKRERRITRAKRQQTVAFRQHGIRRPAQKRGPARLPNPRRGFTFAQKQGRTRKHAGGRESYKILDRPSYGAGNYKPERPLYKRRSSKREARARRILQAGRLPSLGRLTNPSPANVFSEFRGKGATTKTKATAASGTPRVLAKLGGLQEIHVRGKRLQFGNGAALAADGRKKLHITGAKFQKPNPPGEVDYGEILSVVYRADKPHIEAGTFDYKHHFGEDGGRRPHLIVDQEGYPKIEGGDYRIDSDGIID